MSRRRTRTPKSTQRPALPSEGGSWTRDPDGSLKRRDDTAPQQKPEAAEAADAGTEEKTDG